MSVNYRSGIGYGKSFRTAPNTGGRGNAEYRDVLAAGKYLQSRPDVDPAAIAFLALVPSGSVSQTLYDVVSAISAVNARTNRGSSIEQ